jgi:hypothetical protein
MGFGVTQARRAAVIPPQAEKSLSFGSAKTYFSIPGAEFLILAPS